MEKKYFVHETAVIEQPCEIGKNTKIWHFSHVMAGAKIGKDCNIGQNVFIDKKAIVGNGVKIQNNVSIYDEVVLEDYVFCGPSCVFTNVINPRSEYPKKDEFKKTLVKRGATIGANATVVCGITIGEHAFIGAGAVVLEDTKPYSLHVGVPSTLKGWVCECGERLSLTLKKKEETAKCKVCGKEYKKDKKNKVVRL